MLTVKQFVVGMDTIEFKLVFIIIYRKKQMSGLGPLS